MRKLYLISIFILAILNCYGQEETFGRITITPYISDKVDLGDTGTKYLRTKMAQIVTIGEATGGFDQRFIITPALDVLEESTTASIPQKTSLKVSITFFIGDGIAGALFGSNNIEVTGIGDSHKDAIYSAIKKINAKDKGLQTLISESKKSIVKYYDTVSPSLIKEAEGCMANADYETALSKLAVIPFLCKDYDTAQKLIVKCGGKILERDNAVLLMKAKTAWNTSPNKEGARKAGELISQMNISSASVKSEVNQLNNQIKQRLIQIEEKEMELEQVRIINAAELRSKEIEASAKVTSSFFGALPKLVYSIFSWF